uniref:Uncharacterized protein n=1 Tax=Esox lucius TaxID=8010 RepID=A0AAY5K9L9_ESOLU
MSNNHEQEASITVQSIHSHWLCCLDAKVLSQSTSTTLYSSMVAFASSTDECPFFPSLLTWMLRLNRALVSLFREATSFSRKPAFWLRRGMREVDLKSLWTACPITTFPARIFSIYRGNKQMIKQYHSNVNRVNIKTE